MAGLLEDDGLDARTSKRRRGGETRCSRAADDRPLHEIEATPE
jgi:hypothetical protein